MNETGSVKFTCEHVVSETIAFSQLRQLNECRRQLRELGLVGVNSAGIGFGNLSVREPGSGAFYITGSATGELSELNSAHLARVTAYDYDRNWLRCEGLTVASSESLTHAATYEGDTDVMAVIHCHSANLWKRLLGVVPTTRPEVQYGTPEMACEVLRLFATTNVRERKLFVMAGHVDGIVSFGRNLDEAFRSLISGD